MLRVLGPLALVALTVALRVVWIALVPTVPQSDYAMYWASARHLVEHGAIEPSYLYMPGILLALAPAAAFGWPLWAAKLVGVAFAALGAGALYGLTRRLFDERCATLATMLYAVWPAGVALASVLGTDVPATALLLAAWWALVALADRRPWLGTIAFGAILGVGVYFRAVLLPIAALSGVYWWLRQTPLRVTLARAALATAVTGLLLAPWIARNHRRYGELVLTDSHGGITAMLGSYPNTDGINHDDVFELLRRTTGRSIYADHRGGDRAAYAIARAWVRFDLRYTLALVGKRAVRLFGQERQILCWSFTCPGVLDEDARARLAPAMRAAERLADAFYAVVMAAALVGLTQLVLRRRWVPLVLVPVQLALASVYVAFFGAPRYHVPIEALALPFAAFALLRLAALRRDPFTRHEAVAAAVVLVAAFAVAPGLARAADAIAARRRWAVSACARDGHAGLCAFRRADDGMGPSPLVGRADAVGVTRPTRFELVPPNATTLPVDFGAALACEPADAFVRLVSGTSAAIVRCGQHFELPLRGPGALLVGIEPVGAFPQRVWLERSSLSAGAQGP